MIISVGLAVLRYVRRSSPAQCGPWLSTVSPLAQSLCAALRAWVVGFAQRCDAVDAHLLARMLHKLYM